MNTLIDMLFQIDVLILLTLLIGSVWSVVLSEKRIWPPPRKRSWQYVLTWVCFFFVFALNTALLILDWNTWIFNDETRFIIGIPLSVIGTLLVSWGIITLGASNTSGLKRGLKVGGPYQFTRNPQYLGDMILFIGLSILANSNYLFIAHVLLILIFMIIPLAEETWLEEQYGDAYLNYKRNVSRFL